MRALFCSALHAGHPVPLHFVTQLLWRREAFRNKLAVLLEHRLFYIPSFKIYGTIARARGCALHVQWEQSHTHVPETTPSLLLAGGVAGLYDYGPTGCAVKANVTAYWRKARAAALAEQPRGVSVGSLTGVLRRCAASRGASILYLRRV